MKNDFFKYTFRTPLGLMLLEGNKQGLTYVKLAGKPAARSAALPAHFKEAEKQLKEYFARTRRTFDLPLIFPKETSAFRRDVWRAMAKIPYGKTVSYGELAAMAGHPKAARAVGGACNKNPFTIIRPCHRVIGANGALTGFGCGLPIKEKLLKYEAGN